jgi:CRP-like cAMP-binding protein
VTDLTEHFAMVDLFEALDREDLAVLAARAECRTLRAGEVLFREGVRDDALYVVEHGTIGLTRGDRGVGMLGAGATFGDLAVVGGDVRDATAVALETTLVATLRAAHIEALIDDEPALGSRVYHAICAAVVHRLRTTAPSPRRPPPPRVRASAASEAAWYR